jgi:hypothetical protein
MSSFLFYVCDLDADILAGGNLDVDKWTFGNLKVDILTAVNMDVDILVFGSMDVDILSVGNLDVGKKCGAFGHCASKPSFGCVKIVSWLAKGLSV